MFEKSLSDLIRGIRANKNNEARFISQSIDEIRQELKQDSINIKTQAIAKLTYLQMLGYDVGFASFNIIEVMASPKFSAKRIGYLAASQVFNDETDVLMLTTNMVKKDLASHNQFESGVAMNGLSNFITPDIARDLSNDLVAMVTSSRPYVRKRATLILYKVFLKFPDALRPAFSRLRDKLEDADPSVQSAAVNVICELARKNPKNYLSLAPVFFKLLTESHNNWMLIKVVKLLGALTPLEPRLGKKLVEPLSNLMTSTPAMSLMYECINTVIVGMSEHKPIMQLCVSKLRLFVDDSDQNLKYLGLLAMGKILKTHPKLVAEHRDLVLKCLEEGDESIRMRCLDLLVGMATKKNIGDIVKRLVFHMQSAESTIYRDEVVAKIIQMCNQDNYAHISDFEWYVSVVIELTKLEATRHGRLIAAQLMDVIIRVKVVRAFAVPQMAGLLASTHLMNGSQEKNGMCEVLYAAAWIVGEMAEFVQHPIVAVNAMMQSRVMSLPGHIQSVFLHNALKLYAFLVRTLGHESEAAQEVATALNKRLPQFVLSGDLEVQERACCVLELMRYFTANSMTEESAQQFVGLFAGELNPVAPKAQKKVPVPDGLDLDKWINEPPKEESDESDDAEEAFTFGTNSSGLASSSSGGRHGKKKGSKSSRVSEGETEEERERKRLARIEAQRQNPHYLGGGSNASTPARSAMGADIDVDSIPVQQLDLGEMPRLTLDTPASSMPASLSSSPHAFGGGFRMPKPAPESETKTKKSSKKGKKKKSKRGGDDDADVDTNGLQFAIATELEMPEGATLSDGEDAGGAGGDDDVYRALDMDLDAPLRAEESLPVRQHRQVSGIPSAVSATSDADAEARAAAKKLRREQKEKEKEKKKEKKRSKKEATNTEAPLVAVESGPAADDLDFWLSPAAAAAAPSSTSAPAAAAAAASAESSETVKKDKKKKDKKDKKDKKEKKEKRLSNKQETLLMLDASGDDKSVSPTPTTAYRPLASDAHIAVGVSCVCNPLSPNLVHIVFRFQNLSQLNISSFTYQTMDSLNVQMLRATPDAEVPLPISLAASCVNEAQVSYSVKKITVAQRLRGTLTYMVQTESGMSSEKLDFKLPLTPTNFFYPTPCEQGAFASLLSSGALGSPVSARTQAKDATAPFTATVAQICGALRFFCVEQMDSAASLYGCSVQNHQVAVLLKKIDSGVSIDLKCSDSELGSAVMDEIKAVIEGKE